MKDVWMIDDRPDDDPDVIKRREEQWNSLTSEEQAEIDRRVAELKERIEEAKHEIEKIGSGFHKKYNWEYKKL